MMSIVETPHQGAPASQEAEKGLLACLLLEWDEVIDSLPCHPEADWFTSPIHRRLFETCVEMSGKNLPISATTAIQRLTDDGYLDIHGNLALFNELFSAAVTRSQAAYFFNIVREKARLRELHASLSEAIARSTGSGASAEEVISGLEADLFSITDTSRSAFDTDQFMKYVDGICSTKILHGMTTCVSGLDNLLGGWRQRLLYAVAARPGIGKTSLMLQSMIDAWRAGKSVLFFSADMAEEETWLKAACQATGVNSYLFLKGLLPRDGVRVVECQRQMMESKRFHICGHSSPTSEQVFSIVRSHRRRYGVELVGFDYYTCVSTGRHEKALEAYNHAADVFRTIARECCVAMVVLAQLNRAGSGEPQAEHIKDCDALLSAADAAVLLWSDKPPAEPTDPIRHFFKVAKNRYGPRGVCEAMFNGQLTTYLKDQSRS